MVTRVDLTRSTWRPLRIFLQAQGVVFNLPVDPEAALVLRCSNMSGLLCVQFKDGKTSLEAVHVGGRPGGTVCRLVVRVPCGLLVQEETLERRSSKETSSVVNPADL